MVKRTLALVLTGLVLAGCHTPGTSSSAPGFLNHVTLENDLKGTVTARLNDSTGQYYDPSVTVTNLLCVPDSSAKDNFDCVITLSDDTTQSATAVVAADGNSYVTK